ncbi:MAG: oligosaccharide flippase family protein [Deltaproteobacteria bacterium]|nr:oligosaccharide flippase family protein [Deltaproteobacteria bacterium]
MTAEAVQSVQARAVRSAGWTIAAGLVTRVLGLVGSVAITHYLTPDIVGEVGAAVVLVFTANQLSTVGVGNYVVAKPDEGPKTVFHITAFHLVIGVVALFAMLLLAAPLSAAFHAPRAALYVPGLALSVMLDRIGYVPERLLSRSMRFRRIAGARAAGDLAFTVASLALAIAGFGGMAIVLANVLRSALRAALYVGAVPMASWLSPHRLERATYRRVLRFGVPIWLGSLAVFAASRWDNLLFSYLFGIQVMGQYQVAYNLADVPADQIGEQVGEVLLPSFARMDRAGRGEALVSSTGILAFVVFPAAIGFGAIASTLVPIALGPAWASVAPMLTILCVLSVIRPLNWQVSAYLLANDRPRVEMIGSFLKLIVLVGALLTLGRLGPLWACLSVGLGFGAYLLAAQWTIQVTDGIRITTLLGRCVPALLACVPMVLAVLGARWALASLGLRAPVVGLLLEIAAGVLGYVVGAFTLARGTTREFLSLVAAARARRAETGAPSSAAA